MAEITANGWTNKNGTSGRSCKCGTWAQHWVNGSGKAWPAQCSVSGCFNPATLGGHIINKNVTGEHIVPMCASCNNTAGLFNLKGAITVISANQQNTCAK